MEKPCRQNAQPDSVSGHVITWKATFYAFYAFYAWWFYFPLSRAPWKVKVTLAVPRVEVRRRHQAFPKLFAFELARQEKQPSRFPIQTSRLSTKLRMPVWICRGLAICWGGLSWILSLSFEQYTTWFAAKSCAGLSHYFSADMQAKPAVQLRKISFRLDTVR